MITQPVHAVAEEALASRCEVRRGWNDSDQDADVAGLLVTMADRVDAARLDRYPSLRVVSGALKGADNIDVAECTRRGVVVAVEHDLLTVPTAELAVALLLAVARRVREGDALVREERFRGWSPGLHGIGLAGTSVGIVGMGAVGRAIARRLRAFQCDLAYADPMVPQAEGIRAWSLDELLAWSQATVVALPLTKDTHGLIDARRLALMPSGSVLINIGRGSTVDETAVATRLESGDLAGYGADVFALEDSDGPGPPIPRVLLDHPRSVLTPHIGSAIGSVREQIELRAARRILDVLAGREPDGAINSPVD